MAANKKNFSHMEEPHIEEINQVSYNRRVTEYQYFPEEYFSGADCTVYFGDTWVDDLTSLSFSLSEPIKPIFGYAHYTWDTAVRGSRLVNGEFRIAFKEAGYLHVILDHLAQLSEKAKPRLAYLMGNEAVPDWLAGVKENIEDLLNRYHGNPNAKADDSTKKESFLDEFEWPQLKHINLDKNMKDASVPNTAGRKRQGLVGGKHNHKGTQYLGSISQLQSRLIELGYGWPEWRWQQGPNKGKLINWSTSQRPGGRISDKAKATYNPKGDWLLCRRYDSNGKTIPNGSWDEKNPWEVEMQLRLRSYPGDNQRLANLMGGKNGVIDGRYGGSKDGKTGTSAAVNVFQDLCLAPAGAATRAPGGNYLTNYVYKELCKGFDVTGTFDTPTRIAVMLFQYDKGLAVDGIVGDATRKALSPNGERDVKVPGKSRYNPELLFERRAADYEKEVWGRSSTLDEDHKRRTFFYYRMRNAQYLRKHGFDIYITYGPYPESVIKEEGQMATKLPTTNVNFNTTVKALRNIQLTGCYMVLDTSGNPLEEVYQFVAKDLD